ncbi:MAG: glycosyltransferase [Flavobacteriaceae bacterium]
MNSLPISIIICAKNEANNISEFLPYIINQEYENFEIILVNDHSTDATLEVMQSFKNEKITLINLTNNSNKGNKKNALTQGINAAKNEHLLFTDADCKPVSNQWIKEMSTHFTTNKVLVLGYGAHQKIKNSWFNKLLRFETLLTAIQYFSYAKKGIPYMGVGRNIAFTKTAFQSVNGFKKHEHILSGDDDLFVNEIASYTNTAISIGENSFTSSKPHVSFKKWLHQKRRHISTANTYKPLHKFLLGLFYISQFSFWILGIYLIIIGWQTQLVSILMLIRIGFQYLIFGASANKLNEKDLILYIPILELCLISIQMRIFIANLISKPKNW